MFTSSWRSYAG